MILVAFHVEMQIDQKVEKSRGGNLLLWQKDAQERGQKESTKNICLALT